MPSAAAHEPGENSEQGASLLGKTSWGAVASLAPLAGRFIGTALAVRHLGPILAGHFAYLLWWADVLVPLCGLGLATAVTRFVAELNAQDRSADALGLFRWATARYLMGLLVSVIGLASILSSLDVASPIVVTLLVSYFCLQALVYLYNAYLAGLQRFRLSAGVNGLSATILVVAVYLLTRGAGVEGAVGAYAIGSVIPAIACLWALLSMRVVAFPSTDLRQAVMRFGLHTWLALLVSSFIWTRLEIVFLAHYSGPEAVAMFTAALNLSLATAQLPTLLSTALLPHFSSIIGRGDSTALHEAYAGTTRQIALLCLPICFVGAALTPVVVPLLYGSAFQAAIMASLILVASSALNIAAVGSALMLGMEKARFIAIGGTVGAIFAIAACFLIIPTWGLMGAVWVKAVVQLAMVSTGTWYIAKRLAIPIPLRSLGKIAFASAMCGVVAFVLVRSAGLYGALAAILVTGLLYPASVVFLRAMEAPDIRALGRLLMAISPRLAVHLERLLTA